ncbi:glycosyltransferase [Desulfuromonas sp. AOP6]|uniref:glycosyltransferase n=1 Tax=Desulfuromonas sp. AOP6 TaxID=1566351 RepID=UPI00127E5603|nr:glycosyltransferase [Desulfuromonas sp. AOP6]BCA80208.1 hypothetical protein AOP6_1995 [Desulfuromonas sp. AOP6]
MNNVMSESKHCPFVSVIIPTYYDWDRLKICLLALSKQSYPENSFEVIIVNNDPDDKSVVPDLFPNYIFISESKLGSYAARNAGVMVARGDLFAFTDSDCIPHKDWLTNGIKMLEAGVSRIGGKIELNFKSKKRTCAEIYDKAYAFQQERYVENMQFAVTANMMSYKSVFEKVGKFNESLLSCGDFEWGKRASELGFSIKYCDNSVVSHPARNNFYEIYLKNRRLSGGNFFLSKNKSLFKFLYNEAFAPFSVLSRLLKRGDLTLYEKCVAFFLAFFLKIARLFEMVCLSFGRKPERK